MASSLLGLAPGGGYLAIHITADAGGLLHHLFTITPYMSRQRRDIYGAVCFCGPSPAGSLLSEASPPRMLSDAVLFGVRTFLDPAMRDRDRPTDLRKHYHTRKEVERQLRGELFKQSS